MTVLGHIHTFNDRDVIDRSLGALLAQTRPVDHVVLVDNGSTDGTAERPYPDGVTVIRNRRNLGTSGAVRVGLSFGLEHGYDWVWIMDGDSAPHRDALERLLALWAALPSDVCARTWRLSSLPRDLEEQTVGGRGPLTRTFGRRGAEPKLHHGLIFTEAGMRWVEPAPQARHYPCDGTIWAGSLFRMAAVREIGLPNEDYVLDWGEYQYGYRGKSAGFLGFMCQESLVDHNIGGRTSVRFTDYAIGPLRFHLVEMSPIRCYYTVRNIVYFWAYEFSPRSLSAMLSRFYKSVLLTLNFVVRPFGHRAEAAACLRGFWDGLRGNMSHRY